jgi:L-amino acid N-acyltransferase YncA
MTTEISIYPLLAADWPAAAEIYRQGIATGLATFQQEVPGWEAWNKAHLTVCRIAAVAKNEMAGWAALSPVSARPVYAGVTEVSVYVGEEFRGQKIGSLLMDALILESEANGIWMLQSGVFAQNETSIRLHLRHGFRQVGYREKIGCLNGVWHSTVLLERRSLIAGL